MGERTRANLVMVRLALLVLLLLSGCRSAYRPVQPYWDCGDFARRPCILRTNPAAH